MNIKIYYPKSQSFRLYFLIRSIAEFILKLRNLSQKNEDGLTMTLQEQNTTDKWIQYIKEHFRFVWSITKICTSY